MPLVVLSLMRGVLYVTVSAAKGCLMSVHQINNWSHPGLFALFRPQEVLSFDIIGSKSVTLWGHCLPNVQVRNEASVAILYHTTNFSRFQRALLHNLCPKQSLWRVSFRTLWSRWSHYTTLIRTINRAKLASNSSQFSSSRRHELAPERLISLSNHINHISILLKAKIFLIYSAVMAAVEAK